MFRITVPSWKQKWCNRLERSHHLWKLTSDQEGKGREVQLSIRQEAQSMTQCGRYDDLSSYLASPI